MSQAVVYNVLSQSELESKVRNFKLQIILCGKRMEINSKADIERGAGGKSKGMEKGKMEKRFLQHGGEKENGISEGGRQGGTYQNGEI